MNNLDIIIKQLPIEYVNEMGREALESIYQFFTEEAQIEKVTTENMLGWRKYYSVKECCEKLGLNDCETWEDVTEFFPVWERMSDGAVLVAVG